MFAGHAADPAEELQRRSGEHPAHTVLAGTYIAAGQEVAGADLAAPAPAGPFAELRLLREVAVTDRVLRGIDHRIGFTDPLVTPDLQ
ncbi:hypothetical protein [Nocardia sp. NPDC046763]|uniref:hypothetical protein n=1 Tax=Nocardia sp. NPDC046763 TaxID=3155256 RepID=UPI0033EE9023